MHGFFTKIQFHRITIFIDSYLVDDSIYLADTICGFYEKKLLNDLLMHYNYLERPVINESEPLMLKFGITLQQIIDVVSLLISFGFFFQKIVL